jgi:type II secretory pathway predicted ATPase ExeA
MRADFRQPLSRAGYYETDHHRQILKNVRGAILEGRIVVLCGVIGSGKTVTARPSPCVGCSSS